MKQINSLDEYLKNQPKPAKEVLEKIRQVIHSAAPKGVATISYGIPTIDLEGKHLVHFAGFKKHIGFFPTPSAVSAFKKDLAKYKVSKGTVQFKLDEPIPYALIKKIVAFRKKEIVKEAKKKSLRK